MATQNLKTGASMMLVPATLIGVHGLIYAMGGLLVGLMSLGVTGMLLVAAISDGVLEGYLATGLVGGLTGAGTLLMLFIAVVHLVIGGVVARGSILVLRGRGTRNGLLISALVSAVFCAGWTVMALLALNPFVIFWMISAILAAVAGVLAVTEPQESAATV